MGWNPFHAKPKEAKRPAAKPAQLTVRPDGISVLSSAKAEPIQIGFRGNDLFIVHESGVVNVDRPAWLDHNYAPGILKSMAREMERNPERFEKLLEGTSGAGKGLVPELVKALQGQPKRNGLRDIAFKALGDGDHERALIAVRMILKLDKAALGHMAR